ncbi:MAG: PD-(D/E)XK nuclease family protein, partial [Candidatus Binataceae bacterium]
MSSSREIISSSRAADRIDVARAWLATLAPGDEVLVIAANTEAADDLVRAHGAARGALFGVHRMTLNRVIGLLAAERMAGGGFAPAAGLASEAVATRTVFRLRDAAEVAWFGPVLDLPGFPAALARTLSELRLNAVDAAALETIQNPGVALAMMLRRFEQELAEAGLVDRAGMIRMAIGALTDPACPLAGLPTLLLDVPLENVCERELISALAQRVPAVLATIPTGDERTTTFIQAALGVMARSAASGANLGVEDSLHSLQSCLFADVTPLERPLDDSVTLFSAAGEMQECVEIARRIHAEAAGGTPFDRIAVLLHEPLRYAPYLEEAFERASIPVYFARGAAHPEPGGRALLILLACAAENLSAHRFAQFLSLGTLAQRRASAASSMPETSRTADAANVSRFVPPDDELVALPLGLDRDTPTLEADCDPIPTVEPGARAPWRWERLLVDAAVIGGRDRWERRLIGLEAELKLRRAAVGGDEARTASLDRQATDLAHLREIAMPIIDALGRLPKSASWAQWLAHLRTLADLAVRDNAEIMTVLAAIDPMGPVGPVTLDEVRITLDERLGRLERRAMRDRYG